MHMPKSGISKISWRANFGMPKMGIITLLYNYTIKSSLCKQENRIFQTFSSFFSEQKQVFAAA